MRNLILAAALSGGCATTHPYAKDIEEICFSIERSGAAAETDPGRKMIRASEYVAAHVNNPEAIRFYEGVAYTAPEVKVTLLDGEARKVGLASCPLADLLRPG